MKNYITLEEILILLFLIGLVVFIYKNVYQKLKFFLDLMNIIKTYDLVTEVKKKVEDLEVDVAFLEQKIDDLKLKKTKNERNN